MEKPSVFVGSSTEGLEFAHAIQTLLGDVADVTLWNEGFFKLGYTFIETLINALPRFDFAVLVLTPDDIVKSKSKEFFGPRDNVIFELGLFMGRLGRSRTFLVHQDDSNIKLPTDLLGVSAATYNWPLKNNSYELSVESACKAIREVVRDLGFSEAKASKAINDLQRQQVKQQSDIRFLKMALSGIVTKHEFNILTGLLKETPFNCYYSDEMINELRRLRALGLVQNVEGKGLRTIQYYYKGKEEDFDLKQYFYITDRGKEYLQLRNELFSNE